MKSKIAHILSFPLLLNARCSLLVNPAMRVYWLICLIGGK